jgi:hypothetical protein
VAFARCLIGAALVSAVLAAGPSYADATPAPTLTMRTTINGQPAPTPTAVGQWKVTQPGKSASLTVNGANPVGGRTTIVAVWTSHVFHPGRGIAIDATWSMDRDGVAPSGPVGRWSVANRWRHGSKGWSSWTGPDQADHPTIAGVVTESGLGHTWFEFPQAPRGRWQFQVRVRYVMSAAGEHDASLSVSAAR